MATGRVAAKSAVVSTLCGVCALLLPLTFTDDRAETSRWTAFLGGFHPLILHVPIGVIVAIAAFELWSFATKTGDARLRRWLWFIAALTASVSFGTGLLFGAEGGRERALLIPHLWFGAAFTALCWLSLSLLLVVNNRILGFATVIAVAIPMFGAGHYGGLMVHGSPFADAPWTPDPTAREELPPLGDSIAVYTDVVQPVLTAKCQRCHGPGRQNGKLRLDAFERLVVGGEHGPAFIAGRATESRMIRLISLPLENDKHMPPRGRPQLNDAEVALLQWWIDAGAAPDIVVAKADAPPVIEPFLAPGYRLLPDPVLIARQQAGEKQRRAAEAHRRAEIEKLLATIPADLRGALVFSSETSADLNLRAATSPGEFGDDDLPVLAPLLRECRQIDLAGTAITDGGFATVTFGPALRQLSLRGTAISVTGLGSLATATQLETLNLFGTAVDRRIAEWLPQQPSLRRVFLGDTQLSADELTALQQRLPNCAIVGALLLPVEGSNLQQTKDRHPDSGSADVPPGPTRETPARQEIL